MRWKPSGEQLALAIDCAVARVPFERAAALLGIKPRTLRGFLKRIEEARARAAENKDVVIPESGPPHISTPPPKRAADDHH